MSDLQDIKDNQESVERLSAVISAITRNPSAVHTGEPSADCPPEIERKGDMLYGRKRQRDIMQAVSVFAIALFVF